MIYLFYVVGFSFLSEFTYVLIFVWNIDDLNAHVGILGLYCYCKNYDDLLVNVGFVWKFWCGIFIVNIDDLNAHIGFVGLFFYCENHDDSIVTVFVWKFWSGIFFFCEILMIWMLMLF